MLGEVDDYMHCVQLSIANEVVNAMPELEKALAEFGHLDGAPRPK